MAIAHEIALEVLREFGGNVVARKLPRSYGDYAAAIGRDPASHGLAIGQAMHAIGAICVVRQVPVAPLFWVRRSNGEERQVFASDPLERRHILESKDFDVMYVVAREYEYTSEDFGGIERALEKSLKSESIRNWSPHQIWHLTFQSKPKESEVTYYERAMLRYRALYQEIKERKAVQSEG